MTQLLFVTTQGRRKWAHITGGRFPEKKLFLPFTREKLFPGCFSLHTGRERGRKKTGMIIRPTPQKYFRYNSIRCLFT